MAAMLLLAIYFYRVGQTDLCVTASVASFLFLSWNATMVCAKIIEAGKPTDRR